MQLLSQTYSMWRYKKRTHEIHVWPFLYLLMQKSVLASNFCFELGVVKVLLVRAQLIIILVI